uniref:Uncharacterized protein n=1 Tax=Cucumis melo TaxID=3656 RepID=A0A9I9E426_CUCME
WLRLGFERARDGCSDGRSAAWIGLDNSSDAAGSSATARFRLR